MGKGSTDTMTTEGGAEYSRISLPSVYKLVQNTEISGFKSA